MEGLSGGRPVYREAFGPDRAGAIIDAWLESTRETEFRPGVEEFLRRETRRPGATWESQFIATIVHWLGFTGIVPVAPRLGWVRRRSAAIMRMEIEAGGETSRILAGDGEALESSGAKHLTLHRRGNEANFFLHEGDARLKVEWRDGAAAALAAGEVARILEGTELLDLLVSDPGSFSPNAALRPLVQDAALPTVAYIGGPSEVLYHAQLRGLYDRFRVFRPAVIPRPSLLLVEPRGRRLAERLGIPMEELGSIDPEAIQARAAEAGDAAGLRGDVARACDEAEQALAAILDRLGSELPDTGVLKAAGKLREGLEKGREVLAKRLDEAILRRGGEAQQQAERLIGAIRPGGQPQERSIGWLAPLLTNYGPEAFERIAGRLDHRVPGMQVIDLASCRTPGPAGRSEAAVGQVQVKGFGEPGPHAGLHLVHGGTGFSQEAFQGRHSPVADAAGNDHAEVVEVGVHVEGQAVHRPPLAHPDSHGADLLLADPHPGAALHSVALQVAGGQQEDDRFLQEPQVLVEAELHGLQVQQGVDHKLAGSMVCDLAPAIGLGHGDAAPLEDLRRRDDFGRLAPAADRDRRGMLHKEHKGTASAGDLLVLQPALEVPGLLILDAPNINEPGAGRARPGRLFAWILCHVSP